MKLKPLIIDNYGMWAKEVELLISKKADEVNFIEGDNLTHLTRIGNLLYITTNTGGNIKWEYNPISNSLSGDLNEYSRYSSTAQKRDLGIYTYFFGQIVDHYIIQHIKVPSASFSLNYYSSPVLPFPFTLIEGWTPDKELDLSIDVGLAVTGQGLVCLDNKWIYNNFRYVDTIIDRDSLIEISERWRTEFRNSCGYGNIFVEEMFAVPQGPCVSIPITHIDGLVPNLTHNRAWINKMKLYSDGTRAVLSDSFSFGDRRKYNKCSVVPVETHPDLNRKFQEQIKLRINTSLIQDIEEVKWTL